MRIGRFALMICFSGCAHTATPPVVPTASHAAPSPGLSSTDIDEMLEAEWKKAGITPAALTNDAQYLRRLHIDLLGTLPDPETVRRFVADSAPDKRAKMVDALLADPRFVQHWTDYWDDELMGRARGPRIDRGAFRAWLRKRIADNAGWDKVVFDLISASGQQSSGGARNPFAQKDEEPGINGAVNYLLRFENPNDIAGTISRTFLGVQIQCAQCHDHKTEKWKMEDFRRFAACFTRVKIEPVEGGAKMGVSKVVLEDTDKPWPRFARNPELAPIAASRPTTLDGTDLSRQDNARRALASWITNKDNPWFAKETVNRIWAHFLGRGFVNPVDDLRPGNPADAPDLWNAIAKDFTSHGYDMKRLMRQIAQSKAYQLGPASGEVKLWSSFRMSPMGPIELVGALLAATDLDELATKAQKRDPEEIRQQLIALASFVFDVDEEIDKPSYDGTITQALVMMNGRVTAGGTSALAGTSLLRMIQKGATDEQIVEELYLRTFSRAPTAEELGRAVQYVADAKIKPPPPRATIPAPARPTKHGEKILQNADPLARAIAAAPADARTAALEDVYWSLLNASEFFFNH